MPANSTKAITINVTDQNDNPAVVNDTAQLHSILQRIILWSLMIVMKMVH